MDEAKKQCPYCGAAMEKGRFTGSGGFLPDGEKYPYTLFSWKKRRVIRLPYGELFGEKDFLVAYACRQCKKIIIEYEE